MFFAVDFRDFQRRMFSWKPCFSTFWASLLSVRVYDSIYMWNIEQCSAFNKKVKTCNGATLCLQEYGIHDDMCGYCHNTLYMHILHIRFCLNFNINFNINFNFNIQRIYHSNWKLNGAQEKNWNPTELQKFQIRKYEKMSDDNDVEVRRQVRYMIPSWINRRRLFIGPYGVISLRVNRHRSTPMMFIKRAFDPSTVSER